MEAGLVSFEQIIKQLLSPDNEARRNAETFLDENKKFPDQLIGYLLQLSRLSTDLGVKEMSVLMLTKLMVRNKDKIWPNLTEATQNTVKAELLSSVRLEEIPRVRTKIADCVAELGCLLLPNNGWPELLPFIFQMTQSEVDHHRESALILFSHFIFQITDIMTPYIGVIKDTFATSLNDRSLKVRLAALQATTSFVEVVEEPSQRNLFQDLIPAMLETLRLTLSESDKDLPREALEVFVELAESEPAFLRPHITNLVTAMLTIASSPVLDISLRHLGLEFLVTLAESKPAMVRKIPSFVENLVPILLHMMVDISENPDWNLGEEEDEDDTNVEVAEESLDRLSIALGGKVLVPVLFRLIPTLWTNADWKHRHAALMSISVAGEGSTKVITPMLPEVIKFVIAGFGDAHPRVRWAACNTAGQMATDFPEDFQQQFSKDIIPALISVMDDVKNPRVQAHASSAIINFSEHCTSEILQPYLDPLLAKLLGLLQSGQKIVQEQAITAIAAVADCIQGDFAKYYDTFMPFLKAVLINAKDRELRLLRGKAMECISLIGVAVGKEKCSADAKQVMDVLMETQGKLEPDDPQIGFMLQAWARFCKCLGPHFVPYLPFVMPSVMASAQLQPDVRVSDESQAEIQDEEGWDFVTVGDKNIGIKTSILEEKATACNMLFCYAEELKEGFIDYVQPVAQIVIPLMKFYYHDGVRSAAVSTIPCLLRSVSTYLEQNNIQDRSRLTALFNEMWPILIDATTNESEPDILIQCLDTLQSALEMMGDDFLEGAQMSSLVSCIDSLFTDVFEHQAEKQAKIEDQDFDAEDEAKLEEENEKDEETLTIIGEIIGKVVKTHKETFFPYFQQHLLTPCLTLLQHNDPHDKHVALCILDDIVEFVGHNSIAILPSFLSLMLTYVNYEAPIPQSLSSQLTPSQQDKEERDEKINLAMENGAAVRQAAVYGVGLCAQFGGPVFSPVLPEAIARISTMIKRPDAKDDVNSFATENAVSALGKICQFHTKSVDINSLLPFWLACLPVTNDKIESKVIYAQLCHFIENPEIRPGLLGTGTSNLAQVIAVLGDTLGTDLIDDELTIRITHVLRVVLTDHHNFPPALVSNALLTLNEEQKAKLRSCSIPVA